MDINTMTTAQIINHNYEEMNNSTQYGSMFKYLDYFQSISKTIFGEIPKYVSLPRVLIADINGNLNYTLPQEYRYALDRLIMLTSLESYLYNWGKNKTIFKLTEKTIDRMKSKYENILDMDFSTSIFNMIPNGFYIEGNLDSDTKLIGSYVFFDYDFELENPENGRKVVCMNPVFQNISLISFKQIKIDDVILPGIVKVQTSSDFYPIKGKTIGESMEILSKEINPSNDFSKIDYTQKLILMAILYITNIIKRKYLPDPEMDGDVKVYTI